MSAPGWPARLVEGPVGLRPLRLTDAARWGEVRRANVEWLRPWEATPPGTVAAGGDTLAVFLAMRSDLHRRARRGQALAFAMTYHDQVVGQLTIANIVRGSLNSGDAGYWVDRRVAGRGIAPTGLALAVDHCFTTAQLHRVEANIRPDNAASRRVVEKLGFREEGIRRRYLHIDGGYRDHICYALTSEDVPFGVLSRWRSSPRHTDAGA